MCITAKGGVVFTNQEIVFLCGGVYDVLYHTIGQYIGVEDKRGVKVFEGDILCFTKTDKESSTVCYGEVVFLQDRLMYAVNFDGEHVSFDEIIKKARTGSVRYVVTGNIYEEEYNDLTVKENKL